MAELKKFLSYVIPSVLAFALSGVYAIVDGFFVGNSVGDIGLSTINIAYPVTALIQAVGTGIGMGGAVYYSIHRAERKDKEAREFVAGTLWLLLFSSIVATAALYLLTTPILKAFGAEGVLLTLGEEYLRIICLGAVFQIVGTGLVPLIRNAGGSAFAMFTMIAGFLTNIVLDYLFVWVYEWSTAGAALATLIGQGVSMVGGIIYLYQKKQMTFHMPVSKIGTVFRRICKIGVAPFGITLTPNFSLILINRFSASYGGEEAIASYACISYVISIVYLVLQGVGDGSQPLMSQYYGAKELGRLRKTRTFAYGCSMLLSAVGIVTLFLVRWQVGTLLGASDAVIGEVAAIFPIFLLAIPFIAVNRITTAGFYATEKSGFSYLLTYAEPVLMLLLLLILPRFGGQMMIWWSTALARIISAVLAILLLRYADRHQLARA